MPSSPNNPMNYPSKRQLVIRVVMLIFIALITSSMGRNRVFSQHVSTALEASSTQGAPAFTFGFGGDHGGNDNTTAVLRALRDSDAEFYLAVGDLSYNEIGPESAWCSYVKGIVGSNFPFELLVGNHEDRAEDSSFIDNFTDCLPDRLNSTGIYGHRYYFDYPSSDPIARFILIDPAVYRGQSEVAYCLDGETENCNWLKDQIDEAQEDGLWVIVGMHKNCMTVGSKPSCSIGVELTDLLLEEKVDLILQGHEHMYQRSKQLSLSSKCSSIVIDDYDKECVADQSDDEYEAGAGSVIVIAGMIGGLREIHPEDPEVAYFSTWMGSNVNPTHGFVEVDVSACAIESRLVNAIGTYTDSFTIIASGDGSRCPTNTETRELYTEATIALSDGALYDANSLISVAPDRDGVYAKGASVVISSATPDPGEQWSCAVAWWSRQPDVSSDWILLPGSETVVEITMDHDTWIRAEWQCTEICYELSLNRSGEGDKPTASPTKSDGCETGEYRAGESISLAANPADGWQIDGWSGTDDDGATGVSNSLTMPAGPRTVSVSYRISDPVCYPLTLDHSGNGEDPVATPSASTGCTVGQYIAGESISLTVAPGASWRVAGWSGTDDDSSTSTLNSLIMPAGKHTVGVIYANVEPVCHRLFRTHSGNGSEPLATPLNSGGCDADKYVFGEAIALSAEPAEGVAVTGWSGTDNDAGTGRENTLTMPSADHTVIVTYGGDVVTCHGLTLIYTGSGSMPVAIPSNSQGCSAGKYRAGASISLTATPADEWRVGQWSGTASDITSDAANHLTMPARSHSVAVHYVPMQRRDELYLPSMLLQDRDSVTRP